MAGDLGIGVFVEQGVDLASDVLVGGAPLLGGEGSCIRTNLGSWAGAGLGRRCVPAAGAFVPGRVGEVALELVGLLPSTPPHCH